MNASIPAPRPCPRCAALIPPGAAEGLCPRCLFLGLDPDAAEAGADPELTLDAAVPRRLGSYELLEEIARGGMGTVFRARQLSLGRLVALKVVSGGMFAAPDFVRRFRLEAEAAAALDHPNIVPIFEIGEAEGQLFFSMKLLEGGTLVEEARQRPFSPERAAGVMSRIARAVHYAHQRGVLHRDIKPNNILLDEAGQAHLTDFGLARLIDRESTLTRTIAVLGTPAYMAPEQARGEARSLTTAVDVYGLGAVLYELLTGQPPFAGGTSLETVRRLLEGEPRQPSSLNRAVDRDLETICLKCLEKDPARRYGSAEAMAEDLECWLRREPIRARPATGAQRLWKWVRRRPAVAALVGTAALAMLAVSTISTVFTWRLREARMDVGKEAEANRRTAIRLLVAEATRATEDGDFIGALLPLVEALRREDPARDPAAEAVQRRRLGTLLRQCPRLVQGWWHEGAVLHASWSADGRWLASGSGDGTARVWDAASGRLAGPTLVHTSRVMQVVFSPDGRLLATQEAAGHARLWDWRVGQPVGVALPHRSDHYQPIVFSPSGSLVAIPGPDLVRVRRVADGDGTNLRMLEGAGAVQGLAFDRDGKRLVGGGMDGRARIWDVTSAAWRDPVMEHPGAVRGASFTRDGRGVITVASDWRVRLWEAATGDLEWTTEAHRGDVLGWALDPSGQWFVTAGADNVAILWAVGGAEAPRQVLKHAGGVDAVSFHPEGGRLATGSYDRTARLWSVAKGEELPPRLPHAAGVSVVQFDVSGDRLLTASFHGDVRLWEPPRDHGARTVLRLGSLPLAVGFHASGQQVVMVTEDGSVRLGSLTGGSGVTWSAGRRAKATAAAIRADAEMAAVGYEDGGVWVWEVGKDAPTHRLGAHQRWVQWLLFDPRSGQLLSTSADGTAAAWDLETGRLALPRLEHGDGVLSGDFSPDGQWLATSGMGGICRVWNRASGRLCWGSEHPGIAVSQVVFSPDSRRLVSASWDWSNEPRAAKFQESATGQDWGEPMFHHDGVLCVRFSPDGRWVATGGEDNLARIWHADTGRPATFAMLHRRFVQDVAFSPDSRWLATASQDGTARVWDAATGEPITPPLRHEGRVRQVVFRVDGFALLSASEDGTVRLWDLSPHHWPVEDLAALAELLASYRREIGGDRAPLTVKEMQVRWETLRRKQPGYFLEH